MLLTADCVTGYSYSPLGFHFPFRNITATQTAWPPYRSIAVDISRPPVAPVPVPAHLNLAARINPGRISEGQPYQSNFSTVRLMP